MTPTERAAFEEFMRGRPLDDCSDDDSADCMAEAAEWGIAYGESHCIHLYGNKDERAVKRGEDEEVKK